jgi:hypothetical protein
MASLTFRFRFRRIARNAARATATRPVPRRSRTRHEATPRPATQGRRVRSARARARRFLPRRSRCLLELAAFRRAGARVRPGLDLVALAHGLTVVRARARGAQLHIRRRRRPKPADVHAVGGGLACRPGGSRPPAGGEPSWKCICRDGRVLVSASRPAGPDFGADTRTTMGLQLQPAVSHGASGARSARLSRRVVARHHQRPQGPCCSAGVEWTGLLCQRGPGYICPWYSVRPVDDRSSVQ